MKNSRLFMLDHCKDLKLHHRPTSGDEDDFDMFEKNIIGLLKKGPVGVMVDCLAGFLEWDGEVNDFLYFQLNVLFKLL